MIYEDYVSILSPREVTLVSWKRFPRWKVKLGIVRYYTFEECTPMESFYYKGCNYIATIGAIKNWQY